MLTLNPIEERIARLRLQSAGKLPSGTATSKSFSAWLHARYPEWNWDWPHLQYAIDMLQKQADDEIENLMILMPPQHGKSELQIRYLIWRLMRDASKRVVHAAYNFDYAHSLATRTKIAAGELLDHSKLSNSLTSWRLASGGTYRAVGIGTGLTGHAVDLAIIDDPFKDREEANSEVRRETVWLWYTDVLRTRGNVRKCLIMTPWHEDDLRGRILASPEASSWTVCRLPAIAEEDDPLGREIGEALCPDRKTLDELLLQREMNPYSFQAMFQCHPTAREGSIFRVGELKIEETCPRMVRKVRHWDLAASEKKQSDYTAGVLLGVDEDGKYWVLDVQRGQWAPEEVRKRIQLQAGLDGRDTVIHLPQDPGQAGKAQARDFVSRLAGFSVSTDLESGDKVTRAMPIASQVNSGNVHLISAAWNRPFVEELRSFSQGVHDDQVDAISGAFNHITVGMGYLGTEELAW